MRAAPAWGHAQPDGAGRALLGRPRRDVVDDVVAAGGRGRRRAARRGRPAGSRSPRALRGRAEHRWSFAPRRRSSSLVAARPPARRDRHADASSLAAARPRATSPGSSWRSTLVALTVTPAAGGAAVRTATAGPHVAAAALPRLAHGSALVRVRAGRPAGGLRRGGRVAGGRGRGLPPCRQARGRRPAAAAAGPRPARCGGTAAPGTSRSGDGPRSPPRRPASCARCPASRNVGAHVGRAVTSDEVVERQLRRALGELEPRPPTTRPRTPSARSSTATPAASETSCTYPEERVRAARRRSDRDLVVRVYGVRTRDLQSGGGARCAGAGRGRRRRQHPRRPGTPRSRPSRSRSTSPRPSSTASSPGTCAARPRRSWSGVQVGSLFEEQKVFEVIVWGPPRRPPQPDRASRTCSSTARRRARAARRRRRRAGRADASVIAHDVGVPVVDVVADVEGATATTSWPTSRRPCAGSSSRSSTTPSCPSTPTRRRRSAGGRRRSRSWRCSSGSSCCSRRPSGAGGSPRAVPAGSPAALVGGGPRPGPGPGRPAARTLAGLARGARRRGAGGGGRSCGAACRNWIDRGGTTARPRARCCGRRAAAVAPVLTTALAAARLLLPLAVPGRHAAGWRCSPCPIVLGRLGGLVTCGLFVQLFLCPAALPAPRWAGYARRHASRSVARRSHRRPPRRRRRRRAPCPADEVTQVGDAGAAASPPLCWLLGAPAAGGGRGAETTARRPAGAREGRDGRGRRGHRSVTLTERAVERLGT